MKFFIYFFYFLFVSIVAYSNPYCSYLENYFKNLPTSLNIIGDENYYDSDYKFGIEFFRDFNSNTIIEYDTYYSIPFTKDPSGNLIVESVDKNSPFYEAEFAIKAYDRVISLNDIPIDSLSSNEIKEILLNEDELTFEFLLVDEFFSEDDGYVYRNRDIYDEGIVSKTFKKSYRKQPYIFTSVIPIDLIDIDTKNSKYLLEYSQNMTIEIYPNFIGDGFKYPEFDESITCYYYKPGGVDILNEFNINAPGLFFEKKIEDIQSKSNSLNIHIPNKDDREFPIMISYDQTLISYFSNIFDFQLFPFDTQTIWEQYYLPYSSNEVYHYIDTHNSDHKYKKFTLLNRIETLGYNINNLDYYVSAKSFSDNSTETQFGFEIDVNRQFYYYFAKILIPIFLILLLSWSSFWIKSEEIEAKLTVTIICFLTLIAYNFVIDNDLPKLPYLTWLDYYILSSYVFCGLTTFSTIFDYTKFRTHEVKFTMFSNALRAAGIPIFFLVNISAYFIIRYSIDL